MESLIDNKKHLTSKIVLLIKEFEELTGVTVDFISIKTKELVDEDGNHRNVRQVKTYYTENV